MFETLTQMGHCLAFAVRSLIMPAPPLAKHMLLSDTCTSWARAETRFHRDHPGNTDWVPGTRLTQDSAFFVFLLSDRRIGLPSGREFRMLSFKAEDRVCHPSTIYLASISHWRVNSLSPQAKQSKTSFPKRHWTHRPCVLAPLRSWSGMDNTELSLRV